MRSKHIDMIFGAGMLALAGALWLETTRPQYEGIEALNNGFPPSFYPRILLTLWAVIAGLVFLRGLVSSGQVPRPHMGKFLTAVGTTAAYVWLIGEIGFLLASYPFVFAFMLAQGYRNPIVVLAVGCVFPTAVWWLMTGPMRISLPNSPWFAGF